MKEGVIPSFLSFLQSDTQWVTSVLCAFLEQNPTVTLAPLTDLWCGRVTLVSLRTTRKEQQIQIYQEQPWAGFPKLGEPGLNSNSPRVPQTRCWQTGTPSSHSKEEAGSGLPSAFFLSRVTPRHMFRECGSLDENEPNGPVTWDYRCTHGSWGGTLVLRLARASIYLSAKPSHRLSLLPFSACVPLASPLFPSRGPPHSRICIPTHGHIYTFEAKIGTRERTYRIVFLSRGHLV